MAARASPHPLDDGFLGVLTGLGSSDSYITRGFEPATKDTAELIKVIFNDERGGSMFVAPEPLTARQPEQEQDDMVRKPNSGAAGPSSSKPNSKPAATGNSDTTLDPRISESYRNFRRPVVMRESDGAGFVIGGSRPLKPKKSPGGK